MGNGHNWHQGPYHSPFPLWWRHTGWYGKAVPHPGYDCWEISTGSMDPCIHRWVSNQLLKQGYLLKCSIRTNENHGQINNQLYSFIKNIFSHNIFMEDAKQVTDHRKRPFSCKWSKKQCSFLKFFFYNFFRRVIFSACFQRTDHPLVPSLALIPE